MIKFKSIINFGISVLLFFSIANTGKAQDFLEYGQPNAKVKIEVFSSLTCPHCAQFHLNVLPKILDKYLASGNIYVQLKDFPLDLPALNAAKIQRCLDLKNQPKFLDEVYKTQKKWLNAKSLEELNGNLQLISKEFNLIGFQFDNCLKNKSNEDIILKSRISGQKKYSIDSTPTIIINEKKYNKSLDFKELDVFLSKLF